MIEDSEGEVMYNEPQIQLLFQKAMEYVFDQISLQFLKEFSLLNANELLDSDDEVAAELIREIEASVVEIEENILTEQEFKSNLNSILAKLPESQNISSSSSINPITISFVHEGPTVEVSHVFADCVT